MFLDNIHMMMLSIPDNYYISNDEQTVKQLDYKKLKETIEKKFETKLKK